MSLRATAIATGVAAILGTGAAFAQPAPQGGPYEQGPGPYQPPPSAYQQAPYQHRHHHSMISIIREEMKAGRLSHKEGALLVEKIKQLRVERREEREARHGVEGAPPPQTPMPPQPQQ